MRWRVDRGPIHKASIRGHHWAVLGLIVFSSTLGRYVLRFPLLMRLISGQLNPSQFFVDPQGVATVATIWDCVHPLKGHFGLGDYQCYLSTAIHRMGSKHSMATIRRIRTRGTGKHTRCKVRRYALSLP